MTTYGIGYAFAMLPYALAVGALIGIGLAAYARWGRRLMALRRQQIPQYNFMGNNMQNANRQEQPQPKGYQPISLPIDILQKLQALAVLENKTIEDILDDMIELKMSKKEGKGNKPNQQPHQPAPPATGDKILDYLEWKRREFDSGGGIWK
jgi:hypothetical protein